MAFEQAQKEAELIEVIGAFDRAEGWGRQGALSCAHWLTWRIGLSPITAREKVRVARALPKLLLVAARFREGTLSYSKVRALTRVAEPATEALLIDIADATTASQLERVCGRHQAALSAAAAADNPVARAHRRHLRAQFTDDGWYDLKVHLAPEEGAQLDAAIDAATERLRKEAGTPEDAGRNHPRPTRVDGLLHLLGAGSTPAEVVLHVSPGDLVKPTKPTKPTKAAEPSKEPSQESNEGLADAVVVGPAGGEQSPVKREPAPSRVAASEANRNQASPSELPSPDPCSPPPGTPSGGASDHGAARQDSSCGDLPLASRHGSCCCASFAVETLGATPPPCPSGDDGTQVSAESSAAAVGLLERAEVPVLRATARRLACDAAVVEMAGDADGNPLDVGRRTRKVPPALLRALRRRDEGRCRFPGCSHSRWLHAHHIEHWADGGATRLGNLVLLCSFHHALVHEGGFDLGLDEVGDIIVHDPLGRPIAAAPPLGPTGERPKDDGPIGDDLPGSASAESARGECEPASSRTFIFDPDRPSRAREGATEHEAAPAAAWALAPPLLDFVPLDVVTVVDALLQTRDGCRATAAPD